jgi:hypothetical protein
MADLERAGQKPAVRSRLNRSAYFDPNPLFWVASRASRQADLAPFTGA